MSIVDHGQPPTPQLEIVVPSPDSTLLHGVAEHAMLVHQIYTVLELCDKPLSAAEPPIGVHDVVGDCDVRFMVRSAESFLHRTRLQGAPSQVGIDIDLLVATLLSACMIT